MIYMILILMIQDFMLISSIHSSQTMKQLPNLYYQKSRILVIDLLEIIARQDYKNQVAYLVLRRPKVAVFPLRAHWISLMMILLSEETINYLLFQRAEC